MSDAFQCHITINNQTTSNLKLLKTDIPWGEFTVGPVKDLLPKKTALAFVAKGRSWREGGTEGTVWYQVGDDPNNTVKIYFDVPIASSPNRVVVTASSGVATQLGGFKGSGQVENCTIELADTARDIRDDIKHIVVLMLENRSFDNLLGWLYAPGNRPQRNIPPENPPKFDGLVANGFSNKRGPDSPPVYATRGVTVANKHPGSCPHEEYPSFLEQMCGFDPFEPGHEGQPLRADMSGFLKSYARVDGKTPETIMESHSPEQLPVISELAKQFAVCDRWFSSIPSETWPNRSFVHAGTSFGRLNNGDQLYEKSDPVPNTSFYPGRRTVFDVLSEQGKTWKVYQDALPQFDNYLNPLLTGAQFWTWEQKIKYSNHTDSFRKVFLKEAMEGNLPSYSFVEPRFVAGANDQHPGPLCDMRAGEELIYDTYHALSTGRGWNNTLLIILYDEHGGCYDHVPPPDTAVPPDGRNPQFPFAGFSPFRQFGPRVPAVVVSPFIEPGTVFRAPKGQTEYDHTSVLATIRDWVFRGAPPSAQQWLPSKRIEAAPTLWPVLTLTTARAAPDIRPRLRARAMLAESPAPRGPERLRADSPAPSADISSMNSLQLALAIEAEALQRAINLPPTGTPEEMNPETREKLLDEASAIDPETWQKLVDEATARYQKEAGTGPRN
jgi:phospholipase C